MKFTTYAPAVDPNVMHPPAVQASQDINVYGGGERSEGYGKLAAAFGQVARVMAKRQEDLDTVDVLKARNEVMTRLTKGLYGEDGLFTTGVGENAKGLTDRTTALIHKTYEDVMREGRYNGRVRYALQGNINENMANFQRSAASQEMREGKNAEKETLAANLTNNNALAELNYNDMDFIETMIADGRTLVAAHGKKNGLSGAQILTLERDATTHTVQAAVGAAMESGDTELAKELVMRHRGEINGAAFHGLLGQIKAQERNDTLAKETDAMMERHRLPDGSYDMEGVRREIDGMKRTVRRRKRGAGGASFLDTGHGDMDKWLGESAKKHDVDLTLLHKVAQHESHYNGAAVSEAGALGVMQLMPGTAAGLGVDPYDDRQNIDGGAKYLKQCLKAAHGDVHEALARYNGGPNYYKTAEAQRYADEVLAEQINGTMAEGGGAATYNLPTQGTDIDDQVYHLKPAWRSEALPAIGGILNEMGLAKGAAISSGARSREHNRAVGGAEHSHHIDDGDGGDAVDIVLPDGTTPAQAEEVRRRFEATGAFGEVLYHEAGSGWHLHLGQYRGGLAGGAEEEVEVAYTTAEKDQMWRRAEARMADDLRAKAQREKALYENTMARIDQCPDYTSAVAVIDGCGLPLDKKQTFMSMAAHKFGVVPSGGGSGGHTGSRGGRSGGAASNETPHRKVWSKDYAQEAKALSQFSNYLHNDKPIRKADLLAAKRAGNLMEDGGYLSEEDAADLYVFETDEDRMSRLTAAIESNGLSGAYAALLEAGVSPTAAAVILSKVDISYADE